MSNSEIQGTKLVELYHRYVGEPESKRDVYGYWLFLLGSVAGMAGVTVFQVEQLLFAGNFQVREWAIALAAAGLTLTMFGVVVLLPVLRSTAPEAGQLDIDTLAFELHRDDDWQ